MAIRPQLGHPVSDYFSYVNGNPPRGRSVYISADLGLPALRADLGARDRASAGEYASNIRRNQVAGAKTVTGDTYTFSDGQTAYNGLRVKFGPRTSIRRSGWLGFFGWASFIGGRGSGPFQVGNDSRCGGRSGLRFLNSFGRRNRFYGTRAHHDSLNLPFPDRWMDILIGVRYSTSWRHGWLEVSWKWASEPVSAFRDMTFPVPGRPTRYVTRTIGDTPGENRFGPYSGAAMDVQEALAGFFVARDKQVVLDAFAQIGSSN